MANQSPKQPRRPKADRPDGSDNRRRFPIRALIFMAAVLTLIGYLATGFYVVEPDERAVVRRFGKIIERQASPGVHYAWPAPIGQTDILKTMEVKRVVIGLDPETRTAIASGDLAAQSQSPRTDLFTGDVNIVKTTMVARYQIAEPDRYLTSATDPEALVRLAVQSVMVKTVGGYTIDQALTEGKAGVESACLLQAQQKLKDYDSGIALLAVNLESIEPPFAISDAFKDVASAKKDREKNVEEAHAFAESIVTKTRGRAYEDMADARGYYQRRTKQAQGKTDRFKSILTEYQKAPEVTRTRLLLNTLTKVHQKADTYVITAGDEDHPLRLTIGSSE